MTSYPGPPDDQGTVWDSEATPCAIARQRMLQYWQPAGVAGHPPPAAGPRRPGCQRRWGRSALTALERLSELKDVNGPAAIGGAFGRDWTKGSVSRNLLLLSWPMVVSGVLNIMGPTIDMVWVGRLGTIPIAAVGVAGIIVMLVSSARWGLSMGTRALIARSIGAGNTGRASHVTQQAVVISAAYAVAVAVLGALFSEEMLSVFRLEADVVAAGAGYLRIMLIGSAAMSFRMMTEGVMQASGDAITPMKIDLIFRTVHVVVAPFLIFGWWVFPRLGLEGAATANILSQGLGMALGLLVLLSGRSRVRLTLRGFHVDAGVIWRIIKIGIPASLLGMQWALGSIILVRFMVPFGTLAVAAHTLVGRVEGILFMPAMALGTATGVLIGQNLGARQPGRAERTGWLSVGSVMSLMLMVSVAALLWPESIVRIFSNDPELVRVGSLYLRISAAGFAALGIEAVLMQSLLGAGDSVPPMLIDLGGVWAVRLPLAAFLPQVANLGVRGVRWALVIGSVAGAVGYLVYFRAGRWKRRGL